MWDFTRRVWHFGIHGGAYALLLLVVPGCRTAQVQRQDLVRVDVESLWGSARRAFCHPQTLLPLTGAVLFAQDDFDQRGSLWLLKHQPLFLSSGKANQSSDDYLAVLIGEAMVTALIRPVSRETDAWSQEKARQLVAEGFTVGVTYGAVQGLKQGIGRTGPDGWKDTAMPSGHASGAFLFSTLANRNLDALCSNDYLRVPLQVSNVALATTVGWARIEGGHHYPSDVLAGAALGHFMAAFLHDALLGDRAPDSPEIAFVLSAEGGLLRLGLPF